LGPHNGKVLRLDLSRRKVSSESFSKYRRWLGGRGVNQYLLLRDLPRGVHPFHPRNIITIGAGLLVGTGAPGDCRVSIDTKNVFTRGIGSANVGGDFGPELRFAGVTNLVIQGRARELSYICIDDDLVEIKDARHMARQTTSQVEETLRRDLGSDFQTMSIGPTGENLAFSASVIVNRARSASRCGVGAVFGSKKLKAIAVRGTGTIDVSKPRDFFRVVGKCVDKINENEFNKRRMKYGVYCYDEPWGIDTPYRNFSGEVPPADKKQKLMPEEFLKFKIGSKTCHHCPIACWSIYHFKYDNRWVTTEALQGNDIKNFGAKLDLDEPEDVLYAHFLCNELGLDEDVASNTIAWAFECFEKSIIGIQDTDGLELKWGNTEAVFELMRRIAYRDGFGNVLSDGCKRASRRMGRGAEYCVHIKGNDLYESLWTSPSWALGVVVSPRGGTHTRGAIIEARMQNMPEESCREIFGISTIGGMATYENKERLVVYMERLNAVLDSLGLCMFTHSSRIDMLLPRDYAQLLSAATGLCVNEHGLLQIGERIHTLEKCFNTLHTNWTRKDDLPPRRFIENPLAGKHRIDIAKWNKLLDRYYEAHGWNKETGEPTKETLIRLGLRELYERIKETRKVW